MSLEQNLCEAIDIIVKQAVSTASYDKTIKATISACVDSSTGYYSLKYQDAIIYAYSQSTDVTYTNGTSVWVLVPGNDMSQSKTILGTVTKLGEDYVTVMSDEDRYEINGTNCITSSTQEFGLKSYLSDDATSAEAVISATLSSVIVSDEDSVLETNEDSENSSLSIEASNLYSSQYEDGLYISLSSFDIAVADEDAVVVTMGDSGLTTEDYSSTLLDTTLTRAELENDEIDSSSEDETLNIDDLVQTSDSSNTIILYSKEQVINRIGLDTVAVEQYIKTSGSIICAMTARTELPAEQQSQGNYGVIFALDFTDPSTGGTVTRYYTINVDNMVGNPYKFVDATRQYCIYDIDSENFIEVNYISLFCYNFPNSKPEEECVEDIFLSNFELYGANYLESTDENGYLLSLTTPQGRYFTSADIEEDIRTLQAIFRVNDVVIEADSDDLTYYWFVEHAGVTTKDNYYSKYGGQGWKCLNDYEIITDSDGAEVIEWVNGGSVFTIAKSDILVKEVQYKCVVVYAGSALSRTITLVNLDAEYDLTITSDLGTRFYYNQGYPTLTCLVNDIEWDELDYTWSVVDINGTYSSMTETSALNATYDELVAEYAELLESIENGDISQNAAAESLAYYESALEEYETQTLVNGNKIIHLGVNTIDTFSTYSCAVVRDGVYLGTASIVLYNTLATEGSYSLVLNNATYVYKYNEAGVSPASSAVDSPIGIPELSFTLYDNLGNEISEDVIANCDITWQVPNKNTMIEMPSDYTPTSSADSYDYYDNILTLNYNIASTYDFTKTNNTIRLFVIYQDLLLTASTSLSFIKEGETGTNGTDIVGKIVPNISSLGVAPDLCILTEAKDGSWSFNFTPLTNNVFFKIQLYRAGERIYEGVTSGTSTENSDVSITWSIASNNYGNARTDSSDLTIDSETGAITYNGYTGAKDGFPSDTGYPVNILKATIVYEDTYYYVCKPIITMHIYNDSYSLGVDAEGGFYSVLYTTDGTRPQYNSTNPFEITVTTEVEGVEEDVSGEGYSTKFNWRILGSIYDSANKAFKEVTYLSKSTSSTELAKNQYAAVPADSYDGECLSNALECEIVGRDGVAVVARVHLPIYFYLNRYGQAALNVWDGNSIALSEDGGYILAPQVGAGFKEEDNSFTGVLMGKVKEAGASDTEAGLFGYYKGTRTIFLDASTGSAYFGAAGQGQIIIDPTNDIAQIYSGNYSEEDGTGLLIDLTTPEIRYGSGNFIVDKDGHVTLTGATITGYATEETVEEYRKNSVSSITTEYRLGTSLTVNPDDNGDTTADWSTVRPTVTDGYYLWSKTTVVYGDGEEEEPSITYACLSGAAGNGIEDLIEYYVATATTSIPARLHEDGGDVIGWTTDYTKTDQGEIKKYLWNYSVATYTSADPTHTTPIIVSVYGGKNIASIVEYYHVSISAIEYPDVDVYVDSAYDEGWTTISSPADVTLTSTYKYLWNYTLITYVDGTTNIDTVVPMVTGVYGDTGDPGVGLSGTGDYYVTTATTDVPARLHEDGGTEVGWETSPSKCTWDADTPYLWNYEVIDYSDGSDHSTEPAIIAIYTEDGRGIESVTEYYAVSTSANTAPTEWVLANDENLELTAHYRYLWNYEVINYTDGSFDSTTPVVVGVYGNDGNSITNVVEYYLLSNEQTGITKDSGNWSESIQTPTATLPYLWNYEAIYYSDDSYETFKTDPVIIAYYTEDGVGIESVTEYYYASESITYCPAVGNSAWETDPSEAVISSDRQYLWNYEVINYTDGNSVPTTPVVIGAYGDKGADGTGVNIKGIAYTISTISDNSIGSIFTLYSNEACTVLLGSAVTLESGDAYLVDGYLFVWTDEGSVFTCVGLIQGVGISKIVEYYQVSADTTQPSISSFVTSIKTVSEEYPYLWNYEEIIYTDGTTASTTPVIIGRWSSDGVGIDTVIEYYAKSIQATDAPDFIWSDTYTVSPPKQNGDYYSISLGASMPVLSDTYKYMWNCSVTIYSNGTYSIDGPIVLGVYGDKGDKGDTGNSINEVINYYYASSSNTSYPTVGTTSSTGWQTNINTNIYNTISSSRPYLWNYEKISYTDDDLTPQTTTPVIIAYYTEDGRGIESVTEYYAVSSELEVPSSFTTDYSTILDEMSSTNRYLWNYEVINYTDGTSSDPTTAAIIGVWGEDGKDGVGISSITQYWKLSTSSTTAPTFSASTYTSWLTSSPTSMTTSQYLWSAWRFVYNNGTAYYSPPTLMTDSVLKTYYGTLSDDYSTLSTTVSGITGGFQTVTDYWYSLTGEEKTVYTVLTEALDLTINSSEVTTKLTTSVENSMQNLLLNSGGYVEDGDTGWYVWYRTELTEDTSESYATVEVENGSTLITKVTADPNHAVVLDLSEVLQNDTTYTFSINFKQSTSRDFTIYAFNSSSSSAGYLDGGTSGLTITGGTSYHTVTVTFTTSSTIASSNYNKIGFVLTNNYALSAVGSTISIAWAKLEKGDMATTWTPAPEDNSLSNLTSIVSQTIDSWGVTFKSGLNTDGSLMFTRNASTGAVALTVDSDYILLNNIKMEADKIYYYVNANSNKSSLTTNYRGFYIGTDGIALGRLSSSLTDDDGNAVSKFQVTADGVVYADEVYISGYGEITSGLVGGWTIADGKISRYVKVASSYEVILNAGSSLSASTKMFSVQSGTWTSSDGFTGSGTYPFYITYNGNIYSSGEIHITGTGEIAGFTLTESSLYNGPSAVNRATAGVFIGTTGIQVYYDSSAYVRIQASDGSLTAYGATIKGAITATSGYIGSSTYGFTITKGDTYYCLYSGKSTLLGTATGIYIGADGISLGYYSTSSYDYPPFYVSRAGYLVSRSGTIGNWDITATTISTANYSTSTWGSSDRNARRVVLNAPSARITSTSAVFYIQYGVYDTDVSDPDYDWKTSASDYPFCVCTNGTTFCTGLAIGGSYSLTSSISSGLYVHVGGITVESGGITVESGGITAQGSVYLSYNDDNWYYLRGYYSTSTSYYVYLGYNSSTVNCYTRIYGYNIYTNTSISVSSDARLKYDFDSLSKYSIIFDGLKPLSYRYKKGDHRIHFGFTSQDVKAIFEKYNLDWTDFAGITDSIDEEDGEVYGSLSYEEFIALLVYEVQALKKELKEIKGVN